MICAVGSKFRASDSADRPARAISTRLTLNSSGYVFRPIAKVDTSYPNCEASVKPGPVQSHHFPAVRESGVTPVSI